MTRGSDIHEEVSDHFGRCAQCRAVNPERVRVQHPIRHPPSPRRTVPDATLAALCPVGRAVYQTYLRWLAEPDE